ncbi:MAG: hypothetical protein ACR2PR_03320 [Pseudohongiellaceae bacterium]
MVNLPKDKVPEQAEQPDTAAAAEIERKPMAEGAPQDEGSQFGRKPLGQPRNLDADPYMREYPDKQLMWVNEIGGDVQRWINAGAEPVPMKIAKDRVFEGITDVHESKWVRAIGGEEGGNPFWVYLLMIDPEIYDDVQLRPERERQEAIHAAMHGGRDQSDTKSGLQSYAPNLPTGDRGLSVAQETEQ